MDRGPTASLGPVPVSDCAHAEDKLQLVLLSFVLCLGNNSLNIKSKTQFLKLVKF